MEGTSFKLILQKIKTERAVNTISTRENSDEVADLLDYSGLRETLGRAFKHGLA